MANMAKDKASIEAEIRRRLVKKRKEKRAASREEGGAGLTLNSMMDMMTIILVFLLKSQGEEPLRILPQTDVPFSTSDVMPKDMTVVSLTKSSLVLISKEIVALNEGRVPGNFKKGGEGGLIIEPLEIALRDEVERQKSFARMTGTEFSGEMTIIADQSTPYRVLVEVMQTAISTEFKKFRFAVIQGKMQTSGLYSAVLNQ